jgi:hypothetical protein
MPLGQIVLLPVFLGSRLVGSRRRPWMASGAVRWLDKNLSSEMTLLEFGSGSSTHWFATRVQRVVSVEPDAVWYDQVVKSVRHLHNVELVPESIRSGIERFGRESFDIVVIDHSEGVDGPTRMDVLAKIGKAASIVVLDDSDRSEYSAASSLMSDWTATRYSSYRPRPLSPTETTIFTRRDLG